MEASLRGYALAVLENAVADPASQGGGDGDEVARDLRQVSDLIATTPPLSQVLTEGTVPVGARHAVVDDLLTTRIVPRALRIVARAITVEHADGLISVLGDLAEVAVHLIELGSQQFEAEEPLLGRIGSKKFASGYATAVFEDVASVADLEEVEDELFRFARTVLASDGLRNALADSSRPIGDRRTLISSLLDGRASPVTIRLARAAIHGRSRDPVGSLEWMAERAAEARGWRVARVSSARGLDETERADLERALRDLTGGPVELLVTDDPRLLGGAVVAIGNVLVDASAQHRLDQLQEQLLGPDRLAWATPGPRESGN
jgi:F-type H+-transporting ATPase subunit delta